MKTSKKAVALPIIAEAEIQRSLPKTEAILLRLSEQDKKSIVETAKSLHLTATEYLVKCHQLVSEKVRRM